MSSKKSYSQILRSSSIMGGAAGISLLLGMIRIKFVAVLIGTTGIGLLASFTVLLGFISTIAGLGIQSSAVRDIASAVGKGDSQAIGRAVITLRRVCWFTGLMSMLVVMAFSPVLSQLTFGSDLYTVDIAVLGIVSLLANLSGGKMALIHGMRRIGDMARANIFGAIFATLSAVGFYSWLDVRGIVPALVSIASIQLVLAWYFARGISVPKLELSWRQTILEASGMVRLGLVFMCTGLMGSLVSYVIVIFITRQIGLQAVGLYSAAFALSGVLVNFVLGAMGADYYPRLTSVAHDKKAINILVNEQAEIGLLLAIPGLLATMTLAPWIIQIFYNSEFIPAVALLQWFVMGCLGRVISWPLGYMIMALGRGRWFLLIEGAFNVIHLLFVALGLFILGIEGVAIGFSLMYVLYVIGVLFVGRHLTGFRCSKQYINISLTSLFLLSCVFIFSRVLPTLPATIIGVLLVVGVSVYSLRGVLHRVGPEHRLFRFVIKASWIRGFLGQ